MRALRRRPERPPTSYAWRRRSLSSEHTATITLARQPARPEESSDRLLLVVDSTHDRRRIYWLDGSERPDNRALEDVPADDPVVSPAQIRAIEARLLEDTPDDHDLSRLW